MIYSSFIPRGGSNVDAGGTQVSPTPTRSMDTPRSTPFIFFTINDKLKVPIWRNCVIEPPQFFVSGSASGHHNSFFLKYHIVIRPEISYSIYTLLYYVMEEVVINFLGTPNISMRLCIIYSRRLRYISTNMSISKTRYCFDHRICFL